MVSFLLVRFDRRLRWCAATEVHEERKKLQADIAANAENYDTIAKLMQGIQEHNIPPTNREVLARTTIALLQENLQV